MIELRVDLNENIFEFLWTDLEGSNPGHESAVVSISDVGEDDRGQGEGADHDAEAGHALGDAQTRDHLDTTGSWFLFLSHQVVTEKERDGSSSWEM